MNFHNLSPHVQPAPRSAKACFQHSIPPKSSLRSYLPKVTTVLTFNSINYICLVSNFN